MGMTDKRGGEMPCYKPMIRCEELGKWTKAKDGHLYHPAKIFSSQNLEALNYYTKSTAYNNYQVIPCGNCIGCRLEYSREWANRGYLEMQTSKNAWFVTLTYDDEHNFIPEEFITKDGFSFTDMNIENEYSWKGCLQPDDLVAFMKNLRQIFKREYNHEGIRFLACGEYGSKLKRPHYHLILFNVPFPTDSFYKPRIDWEKNLYFQNKIIERAWGNKGIINICEATWNTISYVARYITKKINGKESEIYYAVQGEIKEFFRTSRNNGIGYQYFKDNMNNIYKTDTILIKNNKGIHYITPPSYYDKMYEKINPEHMKQIKIIRRKKAIDNLKKKALTTSLTAWEQLQVEQSYKSEKLLALKREL